METRGNTNKTMINKRMKTKIKNSLLLDKAQKKVRGHLAAGGVLLVGGLMLFNVAAMSGFNVNGFDFWGLPSLVRAANSNTTELNVTISAGTLEILNTPSGLIFAAGTAGVASESSNDLNGAVVRDFRGTPTAWNLRAYSTILNNGTDDTYNISNASIEVYPTAATKVNVVSYNTEKVGNGDGDAQTLDANVLVFNSSHNAVGAIQFDDLQFNLIIDAGQVAQVLYGDMTIVVI